MSKFHTRINFPKIVYNSKLNILSETFTRKNLGRCYNREDYTVVVEGTHSDEIINEFGAEYINRYQRGQGNSYNGFTVNSDGNTELMFTHLIDSSD